MGHKKVKVKIYGENGKSEKVELLVDTGSTYSWINKKTLKKLKIEPFEKGHKFKIIEGNIIKRGVGEAIIELMERKVTTIVVFAEEKDSEVLGVYALEGLRLEFDPLSLELRKSEIALAV